MSPKSKRKEREIDTGLALGLPSNWLEALPEIGNLPEEHLVAKALESRAASDGVSWFMSALGRLMFILWPRCSYALYVELGLQADPLQRCLDDAPSMRLQDATEGLERHWWHALYEVRMLDDKEVG